MSTIQQILQKKEELEDILIAAEGSDENAIEQYEVTEKELVEKSESYIWFLTDGIDSRIEYLKNLKSQIDYEIKRLENNKDRAKRRIRALMDIYDIDKLDGLSGSITKFNSVKTKVDGTKLLESEYKYRVTMTYEQYKKFEETSESSPLRVEKIEPNATELGEHPAVLITIMPTIRINKKRGGSNE